MGGGASKIGIQHLFAEHLLCLPLDFPYSSVSKESACNAGDLGSIPGWGKSLQYSCLENPMDRGAWHALVHGVTRVRHDLADDLT